MNEGTYCVKVHDPGNDRSFLNLWGTYPRSDRAQRWHLVRKMKAPAHVREVTYPSDRVDFHGVPVLQLRQVLRSGWFLSMSKQKRNSVMINE